MTSITISGITLGLKASGIGSINLNFKDDDENPITLQIDRVLHLKQLPIMLVSPQQVLRQHRSIDSSFILNDKSSSLNLDGFTKTIDYDSRTNLPTLYTESNIQQMYNMIEDGGDQDSLTVAQRICYIGTNVWRIWIWRKSKISPDKEFFQKKLLTAKHLFARFVSKLNKVARQYQNQLLADS